MDLGTANTIIMHNDKIVVNEPSIVALDNRTDKMVAVGNQAKMMYEKTNKDIRVVRPLRNGVIADFDACEQMMRGLIGMVDTGRRLFSPSLKMVIGVPSGSTEVELRAVRDSAEHAGGREVYMLFEPMAAAIGIGIDVLAPEDYIVNGPNKITALPMSIPVCYQEIAHCLDRSIAKIESAVLNALENTPPELYADILKNGVYLSGGGSMLRGISKRLADKIGIEFHVASEPLLSVAKGTGVALKNVDRFSFLMR